MRADPDPHDAHILEAYGIKGELIYQIPSLRRVVATLYHDLHADSVDIPQVREDLIDIYTHMRIDGPSPQDYVLQPSGQESL